MQGSAGIRRELKDGNKTMTWILHIEFGRKKFEVSHHKKETDEEIRQARIALKGDCRACGRKITSLYRRTYCSTDCAPKNKRK